MIRRRSGRAYWLITQQNHAAIAAEFARAWGDDADGLYAPPSDRRQFVRAVAHHDDGWAEPDAAGVLNAANRPLDIFDDKPVDFTQKVWLDSARRAGEIDPWAGLLVSLHFSTLGDPPDDPAGRLLYAQYEQSQAALRERLRAACGLRSDLSTHNGLAIGEAANDSQEQRLAFEFRVLRACDMLSLCVCRTGLTAKQFGPIPRTPGGASLAVSLARHDWKRDAEEAGTMTVHPWPFGERSLSIDVPYRPVTIGEYASGEELHAAIASAVPSTFHVTVRPRAKTDAQ